MGNLTVNYNHFSNIGRDQLAGTKPVKQLSEEERKALEDARVTTQKLFSTGIAGDEAKDATATLGNIEKVSSLTQGDINAVNLKAAADLGKTFTQGEIQEIFGKAAAPLGAVVSVQALDSKIDAVTADPNAQNLKSLVTTTRDASLAFSQVGKLVVENSDKIVELGARAGGSVGEALARAIGSKPGSLIKTGIEGSSKVLGRVSTGLSIGVAALDVVIAGQDIKTFWDTPNTKTFAKMGLGLVAAGASVLAATRLPGLSTKASVVAALADVGKISVDVDWVNVYDGAKVQTSNFVASKYTGFKQEILSSRLPQGAGATFSAGNSTLPLLQYGVIGKSL